MQARNSQPLFTSEQAKAQIDSAAFVGDLNTISSIVSQFGNNSEVMNVSHFDGATPIILAAMGGHLEVVQELLRASAIDINKIAHDKVYGNMTAIMWAASKGYTDIVIELAKDPRIRVDTQNKFKETALSCAISWCPDAIPQLLKIKDIPVNAKNINDSNALFLAVTRINRFTEKDKVPADISALLAIKELEVDARDHNGLTPLIIAVRKNHLPTIRALLDAGADAKLPVAKNINAYHVACSMERKEAAAILAQYMEPSTLPAHICAALRHSSVFKPAIDEQDKLPLPQQQTAHSTFI